MNVCRLQKISHLGWRFFKQHQQSLQHKVGETRTNRHVVQQALDVIHHHTAELGLVCVIENLGQAEKVKGEYKCMIVSL